MYTHGLRSKGRSIDETAMDTAGDLMLGIIRGNADAAKFRAIRKCVQADFHADLNTSAGEFRHEVLREVVVPLI